MQYASFPSPYIVGPHIDTLEDFHGRHLQVQRFFNMLRSRSPGSLRILGLRRSGKTSFLLHISDRRVIERELGKRADSVAVAFIDLQDNVLSPEDFYRKAAEATRTALVSAGIAPPDKAPADQGFDEFSKWVSTILPRGTKLRLILLLDEFERLAESRIFTSDFLGNLRSLVTGNPNFAWATASFHDLWVLEPKFQDSAFSNVFHPTPIVLGAMEAPEIEELVSAPAAAEGITFSKAEVNAIKQIAGPLPYFLQAAAEQWFFCRKAGERSLARCRQTVMEQLCCPDSLIHGASRPDWKQLTSQDQLVLYQIAQQSSTLESDTAAKVSLMQYGLLWKKNGHLSIAGELLQKWLVERNPDMPPADITPYVPIIVEATKFAFEEAGKWIDDIRKKASGSKGKTSRPVVPAPALAQAERTMIQSQDAEQLARRMDRLTAELSVEEIESLVSQVKIHRRNLGRLEIKKAKSGNEVSNLVENEIEDEANAILEKMERLETLLVQVYTGKA